MTYTDFYIITIFIVMLFFIKKYYDKYFAASRLIKSFIEEIDSLSKSIDSISNANNLLEFKIKSLNQIELSYQEKISKLKSDNKVQQEKYDLDKLLLKKDYDLKLKESIDSARKDALKKSRAILRGQASEHLAPYVIPNTNPKDYRFMGNPIDYICFEGLSDILDGTANEITKIRFVDIKTGKSNLNKTQRRIRDAVNESRVSFEIINLDKVIQNDTIEQVQKVKG